MMQSSSTVKDAMAMETFAQPTQHHINAHASLNHATVCPFPSSNRNVVLNTGNNFIMGNMDNAAQADVAPLIAAGVFGSAQQKAISHTGGNAMVSSFMDQTLSTPTMLQMDNLNLDVQPSPCLSLNILNSVGGSKFSGKAQQLSRQEHREVDGSTLQNLFALKDLNSIYMQLLASTSTTRAAPQTQQPSNVLAELLPHANNQPVWFNNAPVPSAPARNQPMHQDVTAALDGHIAFLQQQQQQDLLMQQLLLNTQGHFPKFSIPGSVAHGSDSDRMMKDAGAKRKFPEDASMLWDDAQAWTSRLPPVGMFDGGAGRAWPNDVTKRAAEHMCGLHLRKRQQVQRACLLCRQSKLKCDEQRPCSRCVKRGCEAGCVSWEAHKAKDASHSDTAESSESTRKKSERGAKTQEGTGSSDNEVALEGGQGAEGVKVEMGEPQRDAMEVEEISSSSSTASA